jgi:hypothetical protein
MKILNALSPFVFCLLLISFAQAQTEIPAGYTKGTVTLANNQILTGYVKDNMKKSSSISFVDETGNNKKTFSSNEINGVKTATGNFIAVRGDFFKIICEGRINFLQKTSDAFNKPSYNGTEVVFSNGTDGKIGDYFSYEENQLKLLNKKNIDAFINTSLAGCPQGMERAKTINGDIARLKEAIDICNNLAAKK